MEQPTGQREAGCRAAGKVAEAPTKPQGSEKTTNYNLAEGRGESQEDQPTPRTNQKNGLEGHQGKAEELDPTMKVGKSDRKNLLSSWYLGVGVALALTLARLLLRDFGPLVPRSLLPGLWWRCWSWVARSCSPGQITASVLVPSSWTWLPRLSPAIRLPPMGWLGWWVCVCLHFLKWCLYYFMEI